MQVDIYLFAPTKCVSAGETNFGFRSHASDGTVLIACLKIEIVGFVESTSKEQIERV